MAAVDEISVRFCEIPRIYDVCFGEGAPSPYRTLIDFEGPRLVTYLANGQAGVFDEDGRDLRHQLPSLPPRPMALVYRGYFIPEMPPVLRTFVRDPDRQPIQPGAWIYVLSDLQTAGQQRLGYILHFHQTGRFRIVDPGQPDVVPREGDVYGTLTLEQQVPDRMVRYCALLSAFPLPAEVLTALTKPSGKEHQCLLDHALARASWLNDPFTCDFVTGTRSAPPTPEQHEKYAHGKRDEVDRGERILYLVNPFAEAARRIADYDAAVAKVLDAENAAGRNPRYVLAKRIEALVLSNPERKRLVTPKLANDLSDIEDPIGRLWNAAERQAEELLRWCGYPYAPSGCPWLSQGDRRTVTFHLLGSQPSRDGEVGLGPTEPNRGKAWKPFEGFHIIRYANELAPEQTEAVDWVAAVDYEAKHGPPELQESAGALRQAFYGLLGETKAGRRFLKKQTERLLGEAPSEAGKEDGLISFAANNVREADFIAQGWDAVLQNLLPCLYMKRGDLAFATLADFIEHKTGVNILSDPVRADRARVNQLKRQHRADYDARLRRARRLIPSGKKTTEAFESRAGKVIKAGQLLARMAAFWEKLGEVKENKYDSRSVAEAASTGLNALELGVDVMPKGFNRGWVKLTQRRYQVHTAGGVHLAKLKLLGSFAWGIDLVFATRDLAESRGAGARMA